MVCVTLHSLFSTEPVSYLPLTGVEKVLFSFNINSERQGRSEFLACVAPCSFLMFSSIFIRKPRFTLPIRFWLLVHLQRLLAMLRVMWKHLPILSPCNVLIFILILKFCIDEGIQIFQINFFQSHVIF